MAEISGIILIGNSLPAIGVVGVSQVAFNKGDKVNLADNTKIAGFRSGLYQVVEKLDARIGGRKCCRIDVHRLDNRDLSRPTFEVVVIDL